MKITTKTVIEAIQKDIADDQARVNECAKLYPILQELEGKPINGITLNEKRLNGFKLSFKYGMYHVIGQFDHLIGYDSTPDINLEKIKTWDACNGSAAQERINQNNEMLKPENLGKLVSSFAEIEKHYEGLKKAVKNVNENMLDSFHFPSHYDIMRLIQPTEKEKKEINLSNFKYVD